MIHMLELSEREYKITMINDKGFSGKGDNRITRTDSWAISAER